ncbi:MAG: hypothetical protein JXB49_05420 [Bacteroidales bacterium]|nr:hypothetical protein [Bacteroidales bacterium]
MRTTEFQHKDWIFRLIEKDNYDFEIEVIDPEKTPSPPCLYKYYSLNENSIDSLLNNYIFASHPRHFNDPYDCNQNIFNLDSTPLFVYQNFLGVLETLDPNISITKMYYSQLQDLKALFIEGFWQIMYSKCGIVALSDLPTNIQMWAYYSRLNGFQIKLDPKKLPDNFKGPVKVRYTVDFDKIPVLRELFLPVLYQICNKEINWKHESEWRYLVVGPDEMEVPFPIFKIVQKSPHNRKFPYDISALKEITLGCYFFNPEEHHRIDHNNSIFDLTNATTKDTDLRLKILNYLTDHPDIETSFIFWEKLDNFLLLKVPIILKKKDDRVYEIYFDFK